MEEGVDISMAGDPPFIYPYPPTYYRSPPAYGWPSFDYWGDYVRMGQPPLYTEPVGLTEAEKTICKHLADAWNGFIALESHEHNDLADFRSAIDACHKEIALRVARRANPEIWQSSTAQNSNVSSSESSKTSS